MFDPEYIRIVDLLDRQRGGQDPRRQGRRPNKRQAEQQEADPLLHVSEIGRREWSAIRPTPRRSLVLDGNDVAGDRQVDRAMSLSKPRPERGGDVARIRVRPTFSQRRRKGATVQSDRPSPLLHAALRELPAHFATGKAAKWSRPLRCASVRPPRSRRSRRSSVVRYDGTRRGKAWDAFEASLAQTILTATE